MLSAKKMMATKKIFDKLRKAIEEAGGIAETDLQRLTDEQIKQLAQIIVLFAHESSHEDGKGFGAKIAELIKENLFKLEGWKDKIDYKAN